MSDQTPTSGETWARVRSALRNQLGTDAFQNWIDPLVYVGSDQGVVHLAAPTSFFGNWVLRNYGDAIRALMCKDGMPVSRLEFAVAPSNAAAPAPGGGSARRTGGDASRRSLAALSPHLFPIGRARCCSRRPLSSCSSCRSR